MDFIKSKEVYKGKRVLLEEASYLDKNGNTQVMEHVYVKPAVAILAVTKSNNIVFIKEKRTAIGNVEMFEIPAGLIEENENPEEAAIRELKEETGYIAKELHYLTEYYPSCGFTNEKLFIYLAEGLEEKQEQELDESEEIKVLEIPKEDAFNMLKNHEFKNGAAQSALMWFNTYKEGL